jgi:hypothetical protein
MSTVRDRNFVIRLRKTVLGPRINQMLLNRNCIFYFAETSCKTYNISNPPALSIIDNIMKLTIAFLSILLVANTSATAEKRRNLDKEKDEEHQEYYYDAAGHQVEKFKMDHDYLSKLQCDQDTFELQKKQMNRGDYTTLMGNIQDSGFLDNETNTYIVVKDRDLNVSFQNICEDSGGHMVSADVLYEDNQDSEDCNNGIVNYSSYPICLAKSCEKGSKTVLGILSQNLHIAMECDPELIIRRNDYSEPEPLLPSDNNAPVPCLSDEGNADSTCLASKMYYY